MYSSERISTVTTGRCGSSDSVRTFSAVPSGRLRRNVKAARSSISPWQRTSAAIHFFGGRRIELGHLALERLALVQQPELQSRAIDGADAFAVETPRGDPGPHVLVDLATRNRMNAYAIGPDLRADG